MPVTCVACGAPDEQVCRGCSLELEGSRWAGGPRRVAPDPAPKGLPSVFATARFEASLAHMVAAYKDDGRRDAAPLLGGLLGEALDAAIRSTPAASQLLSHGNGPVLVVPVPSSRSSRRQRGDAPLELLAQHACSGFSQREALLALALHPTRRVADQAGLGARERAANLEHSMRVHDGWRPAVAGAVCVVVDDVVTTGATLVEAARALHAAGARTVLAAAICATQRRRHTAPDGPARGAATAWTTHGKP